MSSIIRASEVGEYVYCARAWWLRRVMGMEPARHARRMAGIAAHMRHGLAVRGSSLLFILAGILFVTALLLL